MWSGREISRTQETENMDQEEASSDTSETDLVILPEIVRMMRTDATGALLPDILPGTVPKMGTSLPAITGTRLATLSRTVPTPGPRPVTSVGG